MKMRQRGKWLAPAIPAIIAVLAGIACTQHSTKSDKSSSNQPAPARAPETPRGRGALTIHQTVKPGEPARSAVEPADAESNKSASASDPPPTLTGPFPPAGESIEDQNGRMI